MAQGGYLDFETLLALGGGKAVADAACPLCGPDRRTPANRMRKVLRVWCDGDYATYSCARCEASGWARSGAAVAKPIHRAPKPAPTPDAPDKAELARLLWSRSAPLSGSLAETYLRSRECYLASPNLRYLPPRNEHPPAMIARFGLGDQTAGVHLTRLHPDGRAKAGTDADKITLGPSIGQPIVVHDNPDRGELIIAEGIEDAATFAIVTGWSAWAAGTAGRIPSIVSAATGFERLYVAIDDDAPVKVRNKAGVCIGQRPGAGSRTLERVREVRPDVIPLRIWRALPATDANDAYRRFGGEALLAAIAWNEAQAQLSRGEIGYHRMVSLMAPFERRLCEATA